MVLLVVVLRRERIARAAENQINSASFFLRTLQNGYGRRSGVAFSEAFPFHFISFLFVFGSNAYW